MVETTLDHKPILVRLAGNGWLPLGLCILLTLPAVWWLGQVEYFLSHDGDNHRWRIWEFWQVWQSGQVPARWSPDLSYGFGSPLFTYYNPLAYLLGSATQAWGLGAAVSAKLVYGASLVLTALGMYKLALEWYRGQPAARWAALLAATACLYAPYMLANVYQRGAIAEALALGVVPWVLWAELRSLRRRELSSHLALALSVAMLILAHNLTALMFAPVAAVLAFGWLLTRGDDWAVSVRAVGSLCLAATLGLAVSAFYLLPVVGQLSYVQIQRARDAETGPKYLEHFIPPAELVPGRPIHDYSLDFTSQKPSVPHLGLVQTGVIASGLVVGAALGLWRRPTDALLAVGIAVAIFMVSPFSRTVWDITPVLSTFQFPWRFLGIIAISGGLIAGRVATYRGFGAAIALALSIAVIVAGMWVQITPWEWPTTREPPVDSREYERQTERLGLTTDDEFLPKWVSRGRSTLLAPVKMDAPNSTGFAEVKLVDAQPSRWQLEATVVESSAITFDVFYFPRWRATIDGRPAVTRPISELGLLGIEVPAGTHAIDVYQEATPLEKTGEVVSVFALLLAGALWFWDRRERRPSWMLIGIIAAVIVVLFPLFLAAIRPRPMPEYQPAPQEMVRDGPVQLLGARLDQGRLTSAGTVNVDLLFVSAGDPPSESPMLKGELVNSGGQVVAESIHIMGQGLRPATVWQPNMLLTDRFQLELPFGTTAGDYALRVGFIDGPMRPVASFKLAASGAKEVFIPAPATSDAWVPVRWGKGLILDRIDFRPETPTGSEQGQGFSVGGSFSWRSLADESDDYEIVIRLIDGQGEIRKETTNSFEFLPGETRVLQDARFQPPVDLLPGRYKIELLVRDAAGDGLPISSANSVASPNKSVRLWAYDALQPCDCVPEGGSVLDTDLRDGLRILGYEREAVGDAVDVVVYWQARQETERSYTSFIHLLDREGRLVAQYDAIPYDGSMPTTRWQLGQVVPFAARLRMPEAGGPFRLRAGMYESSTGERLATADGRSYISLGLVERDERPPGPVVDFDGGVRLLGRRLQQDGDRGVLTLYWQASRRVDDEYSVFVHVLNSADGIVAQGDGPPELGERTSTDWPPGEVILDPHRFVLPAERPLRVRVGLYRLDNGVRLATMGGADSVDLGEVSWP